jgi:hypothetical protein
VFESQNEEMAVITYERSEKFVQICVRKTGRGEITGKENLYQNMSEGNGVNPMKILSRFVWLRAGSND